MRWKTANRTKKMYYYNNYRMRELFRSQYCLFAWYWWLSLWLHPQTIVIQKRISLLKHVHVSNSSVTCSVFSVRCLPSARSVCFRCAHCMQQCNVDLIERRFTHVCRNRKHTLQTGGWAMIWRNYTLWTTTTTRS